MVNINTLIKWLLRNWIIIYLAEPWRNGNIAGSLDKGEVIDQDLEYWGYKKGFTLI